jgi:hypothetical protein
MFGLAPAQADLQGDSRLTAGYAGHIVPTVPARRGETGRR